MCTVFRQYRTIQIPILACFFMSLLTDLQLYKQQCFTIIQSPSLQFISFSSTYMSLNKPSIWKTVTNIFKTYPLLYKKVNYRFQTLNAWQSVYRISTKGFCWNRKSWGVWGGCVLVFWTFWLIIRFCSQNRKQHCISFAIYPVQPSTNATTYFFR